VAVCLVPVVADASAVPDAVHSIVHDLYHAAKFPALDHDCQSATVHDFHPSALVDAHLMPPVVHLPAHPDARP
jgi:hypothetical protein